MSATSIGASVQSPPFTFSFSGVIDYIAPLFSERDNLDEQLLAERLKRRDEQALSDAYALYSRPVFSFLNRFTGDRTVAEDVQQQVFLEVWQKASSFDPARGSMLGWIMTIARSRALDSHRKRVPEPRDLSPGSDASEHPATEGELDAILDEWHFEQLLAQLPQEESELLKHRFHGGLSQTEISERTGIPLGTVKSRMVSALDRLRNRMEVEA
jgi:RNA polymerase sigma-70 factor (ECF subfamily)